MLDKNGRNIETGMIVRIEGAYFKRDNGVYLVTNSPMDPQWYGSYHSLRKINKRTGALSTAKYNLGSWPILCTTNSFDTRIKHNTWNKENATIEIIEGVPLTDATDYFETASFRCREVRDGIIHEMGYMTVQASDYDSMSMFFSNIVDSLKSGGVR